MPVESTAGFEKGQTLKIDAGSDREEVDRAVYIALTWEPGDTDGGGAAGLATNLFTVFLMRPTPGGNTEIKTDERCATLLASRCRAKEKS